MTVAIPGTIPATRTPAEAYAQSLASGTAGRALLAVERALHGGGDWARVDRLIKQATAGPVDAGIYAGLYYGAPAIAFLLHLATLDGRHRYPTARRTLDWHVRRLTQARLSDAEARLRDGRSAVFGEYDLFSGLAGIGVLLMHIAPGGDELGEVLRYVVRLAEPRYHDGLQVPGWWVEHDPDPLFPTSGGHVNAGMAHGAAGLLALLAIAARHGHHVPGQGAAIDWLCRWFDQWRQDSPDGPWWPQWLTRQDLRSGRCVQRGPGRPSWCYGAAGIARALQLAGIVTGDRASKAAAEHALAACLSPAQVARLTDRGLCHGLAGLYQTAYRAAGDTPNPIIAGLLPGLAARITGGQYDHGGFLTGHTGVALIDETIRHSQPPNSRWDTCLLIA